jgi:ribosome-associated translation inhibitor RaiA
MSVDIAIVGLTERQATALHVVDRLGAILAPRGDAALAARLAVSDQNGPKGGVAIRCAIDARVTRWAPLHADARATSARAAVSDALGKLERRARRTVRMARDGRRRPKKYFVAAVANGGGRRS